VKLVNEFAAVEVDLDETGHGPRLRVRDLLRGGAAVYLDPMQLEALVWTDPVVLARSGDPDLILARVERAADGPGRR
jgi:hypothetical protein